MYDICCIGHITLDKVVTPRAVAHMAGGTSFYFSSAIRNMDVSYTLVTSLAESEMHTVEALRANGTEVHASTCAHTVYFENIYSGNQDHRTQRVLQKADPFTIEQLQGINAKIFHLGPLLADDIPVELIRELSSRGRVSLDAQGYLRKVEDKNVIAVDWPAKKEALRHIDILKVNEHELEALTGLTDIKKGAEVLADWGVKEVAVTLGSMGSVIYADGIFYNVPAYVPTAVVDATGCGDTYMAGYLYQRTKGASFQEAGEFAAAMASFKIESSGPFTGAKEDVLNLLEMGQKTYSY
jgi:sugar/nucleoside kinase (ribokinase family)